MWLLLQPATNAFRKLSPVGAYKDQWPGGLGWTGFGPKALAVSRWGRFVRESSRWRASSLTPCSS